MERQSKSFTISALFFFLLATALVTAARPGGRNSRRRHPAPDDHSCVEPPSSELLRQLSAPMELHTSFYQFPPLRGSVTTLDEFMQQHRNMTHIKYSNLNIDNGSCEESGSPANPCPMIWRFNHDENRFPQTMAEGECLGCTACRSMRPSESSILACTPIHYYMKVLRKTGRCDSATNYFLYVEVYEPITVGCACRGVSRINNGFVGIHNFN